MVATVGFDTLEMPHFNFAETFQLLGIDDHAVAVQGHRATGITGSAAARDNGQSQRHAGAHHFGHFLLAVRADHHKGEFDTPVGGVGGVRYAGQSAKIDIVGAGDARHVFTQPRPQRAGVRKPGGKDIDRVAGALHQPQRLAVTVGAGDDLIQAVMQRIAERFETLAVFQQIVLDIGIARHHPHIPEHLEQHTRRTTGTALRAQAFDQLPHVLSEETQDNFPV